MFRLLGRFSGRLVVVIVIAAIVGGGIAWASIPDSNGVFTACVSMDSGVVRMIDPSLPASNPDSHCLAGLETQVSWNQGSPSQSDAYSGNYLLEIDGIAGDVPVNLTGGCSSVASIVVNATTRTQTLGTKTPVPCTISFGENVPAAFWVWLGKSFAATPAPVAKGATFIKVDATNHDIGEIRCTNVVPSRLTLPAFDTADTGGSFLLSAELSYASCTPHAGSNAVESANQTISPFFSTQTLIEADGIAHNAIGTDGIDLQLVAATTGHAAYVSPITFGLRYAPSALSDVQAWYTSMVVNGSATTRSVIVKLESNGVVFTFGNSGINRLSAEPLSSDGNYDAGIFANSVSISGSDT